MINNFFSLVCDTENEIVNQKKKYYKQKKVVGKKHLVSQTRTKQKPKTINSEKTREIFFR